MSVIDPKFGSYSRSQQMILLIQRNAQLEIELAQLQDPRKLENLLKEKQQVW